MQQRRYFMENKIRDIDCEKLADYLCGDNSPEARNAHGNYCIAYDIAHQSMDSNQSSGARKNTFSLLE